MKKTYQKPAIQIAITEIFCQSLMGSTQETGGNYSKDRGSRNESDDNFEDLW